MDSGSPLRSGGNDGPGGTPRAQRWAWRVVAGPTHAQSVIPANAGIQAAPSFPQPRESRPPRHSRERGNPGRPVIPANAGIQAHQVPPPKPGPIRRRTHPWIPALRFAPAGMTGRVARPERSDGRAESYRAPPTPFVPQGVPPAERVDAGLYDGPPSPSTIPNRRARRAVVQSSSTAGRTRRCYFGGGRSSSLRMARKTPAMTRTWKRLLAHPHPIRLVHLRRLAGRFQFRCCLLRHQSSLLA